MPHPIYGPPSHALDYVTFRLELPTPRNGAVTKLASQGWAETQRGPLWSVRERWTRAEQDAGLQPSDALHHLALVALQDHPASQYHLEMSLTGQGWEQLELPL